MSNRSKEFRSASFLDHIGTALAPPSTDMAAQLRTKLHASYLNASPIQWNYRMTIPERIKQLADENPEKLAFVFREPDKPRETLTRKELLDLSSVMAHHFIRQGIKVGDKVAVLVPPGKTWMVVQFGVIMAGAVAIHGLSHDPNKLQTVADKMGCTATVVATDYVSASNEDSGKLILSVSVKEGASVICLDLSQIFVAGFPHDSIENLPKIPNNCPGWTFLTSGSTGLAKVVLHTHTSLLSGMITIGHSLGFCQDDVLLNDKPLTWAFGSPFAFLGVGCTTVYLVSQDGSSDDLFFVDMILAESPTHCIMMEYRLNNIYKRPDIRFKIPRVKCGISGGHRMTQTHVKRMLEFCDAVVTIYGSSECLHPFCKIIREAQSFEDGTAGYDGGGCKVKIVKDNGDPVPISETGELWVKGDACAKEYLLPDGTTERISDADGWFHSNDVAVMKPDGMVIIHGRTSEIIKRTTLKIFPSFVEKKLSEALDLLDVAVVGVPDNRFLNEVCACVLLKPGSTLTRDDIQKRALDIFKPSLADDGMGYMPGHFLIMDAFPRTSTSKCNRPLLAKMAEEMMRDELKEKQH